MVSVKVSISKLTVTVLFPSIVTVATFGSVALGVTFSGQTAWYPSSGVAVSVTTVPVA